jgi:hypothetical protein
VTVSLPPPSFFSSLLLRFSTHWYISTTRRSCKASTAMPVASSRASGRGLDLRR